VGKASRQRQLKQERERKQRRGIRHEPPSQAKQPSQRGFAAVGVAEALEALAHGRQDLFLGWVEGLALEQLPGWGATVSRELVSYLRASVAAAWRHGWQPAELVRQVSRGRGDAHARMATDMIADEMRAYAARHSGRPLAGPAVRAADRGVVGE